MWFPDGFEQDWLNTEKHGGRGASATYTDGCIELCLMLRHVYRLALRQTRGFVQSILSLMRLKLPVPCFSTLSRRASPLEIAIRERLRMGEALHVAFDATGIKVYGEGEWKVRTHGADKRRTWRKLHLALDVASQEILAAVMTDSDTADGEVLPDLLDQIPEKIDEGIGDGAYAWQAHYRLLGRRKALATIPPREDAVCRSTHPATLNQHIQEVRALGKPAWKRRHGYYRRSLAETAMSRLKRCFGERVPSHLEANQGVDLFIRCKLLNRFFELGKPRSVPMVAQS